MWNQPQPVVNLPKAIVDFVGFMTAAGKDPSLLKPFVEAAQAIQVSQDQLDAVCKEAVEAQKTIDACSEKQKELAAHKLEVEKGFAELSKLKAALEQRELMVRKQQDAQAEAQRAQAAEAQRLQEIMEQHRLALAKHTMSAQALASEKRQLAEQSVSVQARELQVIKREQAIAVAHAALNGVG